MKCLGSPALVLAMFSILGDVALGNGVRIVNASGDESFPNIQAAVDAASEGDVLLVAGGSYAPFAIDGKSLSIVAVPGANVTIAGTVEIRNVNSGAVVVCGLTMHGPYRGVGLRIGENAAHVRLQDCHIFGGAGQSYGYMGPNGVEIEVSPHVALVACSVLGGRGGDDPRYQHDGGGGGSGIQHFLSDVALYECTIAGGVGGDGDHNGGAGGVGHAILRSSNGPSTLFVSKSAISGGNGGAASSGTCGSGGNGLVVDASSHAYAVDTQLSGGDPPCGGINYGFPVVGPLVSYSGARSFAALPVQSDQSAWHVSVQGEPGDRVYCWMATSPDFHLALPYLGVRLVPFPLPLGVDALGTIPASGTLDIPITLPELAAGKVARRLFLQGYIIDAQGTARLASPLHLAVLNRDYGPDCNANGVDDFVEIVEGSAPDANQNLVPDSCDPGGPIWYVDAAAAPGGNGSAATPFRSIAQGLVAALPSQTILVADGVYTGAANRELDYGGKDVVVRSMNGPAACVIDCEHSGRAFHFHSGETNAALLSGFIIRNGDAGSASTSSGGGILVESSSPTIEHCTIEGCSAAFEGGGILLANSNAILRYSTIAASSATGINARGGGVCVFLGNAEVQGCWIENNTSAHEGGGVWMVSNRMSHCIVRGNSAFRGGGVCVFGDGFQPRMDDILIAGNTADYGGGLLKDGTSAFVLVNAILAHNQSTHEGSALSVVATGFEHGGSVLVRNTIVWGNSSPTGATAYLSSQATLDVRYSDFQGGQAAVLVDPFSGSTLVWGAGNVDSDPRFADPSGPDNDPFSPFDNDYHLRASSPCIDAADNSAVPADAFDLDSDGNLTEPVPIDLDAQPRFIDIPATVDTGNGTAPIVDMGCYERQH